jgi:prefoldin subunit 5
MGESEFDNFSVALDSTEFALRLLQKRAVELRRKRDSAKTQQELESLDSDAAELLQRLRKIGEAIHTGNPAPHLRLLPDVDL